MRITEWGPMIFVTRFSGYKILTATDGIILKWPERQWDISKLSVLDHQQGVDSFPSSIIARADTTRQYRRIQLNYSGPSLRMYL